MTYLHRRVADRRLLFAGAIVSAVAMPLRAEWLVDVDAGVTYDDNLTRAQQSVDTRADFAFPIAVAARTPIALGGYDAVVFGADARAEAFARYHGLNNIAVGVSAEYRHKFDLGYAAPWLALTGSAAYYGYREDLRDGSRFSLRASAGKRFTEDFDASIGAFVDRRYASHDEPVVPGISGKPFDLRGHGAFATVGYACTEQLFLGATVSVRRGDVVSTTSRGFAIFAASTAIAEDKAFGDEIYAYRLRGTTLSASGTASWALSNHSSINLLYADERTRALNNLDYRSHAVSLRYVHRY